MYYRAVLVCVVALAVLLAISASAETTVNVSPSTLASAGWTIALQQGTAAEPPTAEFLNGPGIPPSGDGTLHLVTPYSDTDALAKVYVGTNNHNGVKLSDITSFKYYTRLMSRPYDSGIPNTQPPMIELITDSGVLDGVHKPQQRVFAYKPYGSVGNNNVLLGEWQEWDLMASTGRWELWGTSSSNYYGNWAWMTTRYAPAVDVKIQQPLVGDTWDPLGSGLYEHNQSGTGISIKIGSGRAQDDFYVGVLSDGASAWWRESASVNAYVDKLVIGINGVETIYDFEADGVRPAVMMPIRSLYDERSWRERYEYRYVICGKILDNEYFNTNQFQIDDGSGPMLVQAAGHGMLQNYIARVEGQLNIQNITDDQGNIIDQIWSIQSGWDKLNMYGPAP